MKTRRTHIIEHIERQRERALDELIWTKSSAGRMLLMATALLATYSLPVIYVIGPDVWIWMALCWGGGALAIATHIGWLTLELKRLHYSRDQCLALGEDDVPDSAHWNYAVDIMGGMRAEPSQWMEADRA